MTAVDSRQTDGLSYAEFNRILQLLLADTKVAGLQITILDPDLDATEQYTKDFINNFYQTFNSSWKS